ncbi:MAG: NPCBM/NEW2 domain-containing protein [Planctomycetes bacterium]|nr:NPCBM/NEW2 domain-containing protein [Planctomycetota bacterium]
MKIWVLLGIGIRAVLPVVLSVCMCSCSPQNRVHLDTGANARIGSGQDASALHIYENELARTPPMGWNSWNAFHGDIDEQKIRGIADAMVALGMRDAGYTYLVIDDGWMADKRNSEGKLVADPNKFPSGIKALSDYIHGKGLKFGLYQDRGHSTCMRLPGSFGHEQVDMDTFAAWGVDYIKLDSCYAEINGRKSSDDFGVFKECIVKTGRPMVLSMANYTDPSWAWGGQEIGHLWRTSFDIRPRMSSVYYCADTSAGDRIIHPAFNGLWQFAGPGHWNDPDMLQVGNLKTDIENKAHFSLWCILAAPLMAGNDFRGMSETARNILTAEELITVNQDPRGIQGYKVYDDDGREIYNKPLHDGTTAVLLLNKNSEPANITITWDMIGLSGRQKVRDLWRRKDLGRYSGSFTAENLPQHGHMLLKVGSRGKPLATPDPVPLEQYAVTQEGATFLSDLYYIWKRGEAPRYDKSFDGKTIVMNGTIYDKGFGCKATSKIMFKLNGYAERFKAVVALDPSYQGNEAVNFRVRNEDPIGPDSLLYDSGKMTKDTPAKVIDIDVRGIDCLILTLQGKEALGNWADAQVVVSN